MIVVCDCLSFHPTKIKVRLDTSLTCPTPHVIHLHMSIYQYSTVEGEGVLISRMVVQIELNSCLFILVMDLSPNLLCLIFAHYAFDLTEQCSK